MPSYVFDFEVSNPLATNPNSLNASLTSNSVTVDTFGTNANALLFEPATTLLNGVLVSLTVNGTTLRVDTAYHGSLFAIASGRETSVFTVNSGSAAQTATYNGFDSVGPEDRRLWNLNG